jgi:hypothetical protein
MFESSHAVNVILMSRLGIVFTFLVPQMKNRNFLKVNYVFSPLGLGGADLGRGNSLRIWKKIQKKIRIFFFKFRKSIVLCNFYSAKNLYFICIPINRIEHQMCIAESISQGENFLIYFNKGLFVYDAVGTFLLECPVQGSYFPCEHKNNKS